MIDIHCHILPGLDDGSKNLNQSIEMARQAAADGIQTIVATPHIKPPFLPPERIAFNLSILNNKLSIENIPITVLSGGDVHAISMPPDIDRYVIHNGPYVLIEFPHSHLPTQAHELLFKLSTLGVIPIITHPERNLGVIRKPERLFGLLDSNIKVQLTADSLTGLFGKDVAACARFLLKKGIVHFLATDAHSPDYRRPILSKGLEVAEQILGKEEALKLVTTNPAAVLEGRELPEV